MAFEDIDFVGTVSKPKTVVPLFGVCVGNRVTPQRKGKAGDPTRFIVVAMGGGLARKIGLTQEEHRLRISFGTGPDAGKVRIAADNQIGKFKAKRNKAGNYVTSINHASASGLFATEFAPYRVDECEAIMPVNGGQRFFVFQASAEMLAAGDD